MKIISYLLLDAVVATIVFVVLWRIAKTLFNVIKAMAKLAQNEKIRSVARSQGSCAIRVVQPRIELDTPVSSPFPESVDWSQYDFPTYLRRCANGTNRNQVQSVVSQPEDVHCATA